MVVKLRTSYLLPAELADVTKTVILLVKASGIPESLILRLLDLLQIDLDLLNVALTAVRKNELIEEVAEADAVLDDMFLAFRDTVEIGKRKRDKASVMAYQRLWNVLEKADLRLYRLGYSEKAGKLSALLNELDKPEFQADIALLRASEFYSDLKFAESEFDSLYNSKLDVDNKKKYPTLAKAKSQIVPHINILLGTISVLEESPGDADPAAVTALVEKINGTTTEIMATAKARKTRNENRKKEAEQALAANSNSIT
ncbi:MAG: DUF6261 family protein [Bacteroidota bacterium]